MRTQYFVVVVGPTLIAGVLELAIGCVVVPDVPTYH
jgi:hypothetical protein